MSFTLFTDWKRDLLAKRHLEMVDGRALHQYRLSETEFNELEGLLGKWLGALLGKFSLSNVAYLPGFSALFVLYASEWWRRRFGGAHWSWEPILRDIGAEPDDWTLAQRSECVRIGLQDWGLTPRESGGLRFLGSVAVQGGLPLRLLAEARGGIGHLLGLVLKQAGSGSVTQADLLAWVESLQGMLPKSYRQSAIFALLSDVAWTVLRLKEEAGLTPAIDPIARLDQQVGGWRERFPLPIEDDHARGLIEQLVRDAARVRTERQVACLVLERRLIPGDGEVWTLVSSLALPESVAVKDLANLFSAQLEEMPRAAELILAVGEVRLSTTIRRMAGHDRYRLERMPWGHSGRLASEEHVLRLAASDGRVWVVNAPKGNALDDELPWVFGMEEASYRLLRQGGGSVAPMEALAMLPSGWSVTPQSESEIVECGKLENFDRCAFRVRGAVEAHERIGVSYRIRTGQAGAADESYEWRGQRVWLDFQNPGVAFKGLPQLYRIDQEGAAHRMEGSADWNVIGGNATSPTQPIGPVTLRYPARGEIKQRTRMTILPRDASLSFDSNDATSGEIRFENWGASAARILGDGIRHESRKVGNSLTVTVSTAPGKRAPEQLELEVRWGHAAAPVRLAVPFPGRGVRAFAADGAELQSASLLSARQLTGLRLLVLAGRQNARMTLELTAGHGQQGRTHELRTLPGAFGVQIRPQDFATDIQHLLSTDDNPDAKVRVIVRVGGADPFRLDVARYAAKLAKDGPDICLDTAGTRLLKPDELGSLPVLALRLERPGDEPVVLQSRTSEGVPTGSWSFQPALREPGCWLIYPGPTSPLPFRPTLWPVVGEAQAGSPLAQATGLAVQVEREAALDAVIEKMAKDFLDPCWAEVEQLAGQTGHLPLTTLDLWRRFARAPGGMAALALRFCTWPGSFLDRFAQELPVAWEAIPFSAWDQAMACLQRQCINGYGQDAGVYVFRTHLESRINDMAATHGALHYMFGVCSAAYKPEARQEAQALRFFGSIASQHLFDGDASEVMRLRHRHANDEWPMMYSPVAILAKTQLQVAAMLCPQQLGYVDGVINLPLIVAAQAATNQTAQWFEDPNAVHALRAYRAFDPEWFDQAYNLTIARCLADGILEC